MAIVNVTPDSFSDGGTDADVDASVRRACELVAQGADILDIGGESTRPYSDPVDVAEELRRVIPVIEALAARVSVPISIDTSKAAVAEAAVRAGATIINDVTGLTGDPQMVSVAKETGCGVCAMHMQGSPQTMQNDPRYDDVVQDILGYLQQRRDTLRNAGIEQAKICLDPGIGFGKTHDHNWQLMREVSRFHQTGCPILVGHSRKGFIGKAAGKELDQRDAGTLSLSVHLASCGVQVIRVHEVTRTKAALDTHRELLRSPA